MFDQPQCPEERELKDALDRVASTLVLDRDKLEATLAECRQLESAYARSGRLDDAVEVSRIRLYLEAKCAN